MKYLEKTSINPEINELKGLRKDGIESLQNRVGEILEHLTDLEVKSSNYKQYLADIIDDPGIPKVEEVARLPVEIHDAWMTVSAYLDVAYQVEIDIENEIINFHAAFNIFLSKLWTHQNILVMGVETG